MNARARPWSSLERRGWVRYGAGAYVQHMRSSVLGVSLTQMPGPAAYTIAAGACSRAMHRACVDPAGRSLRGSEQTTVHHTLASHAPNCGDTSANVARTRGSDKCLPISLRTIAAPALRARLRRSRLSFRSNLSRQARPRHRADGRRRRRGRAGAAHEQALQRKHGAGVRRRQSPRRVGHHRRGRRREGGARRLHAARHVVADRGERGVLQEAPVRSAEGSRADQPGRRRAAGAGRSSERARAIGEGAGRAREAGAHAERGLERKRLGESHRDRDAQAGCRHRRDTRAVQERDRGRRGAHERRGGFHVHRQRAGDACACARSARGRSR